MCKEKRRPRSLPALTGLLCGVVLLPWLVCMGILTAAAAQREGDALLTQHGTRAQQLTAQATLPWGEVDDWPILTDVSQGMAGLLPQPEPWNVQATDAIFDRQGNCLGGSWENFVAFEALTPQQWENGVDTSGRYARACLRPELLPEGLQTSAQWESQNTQPLRLQGVLEGSSFLPSAIERLTAEGWKPFYQDSAVLESSPSTVTLYTTHYHTCFAPQSTPLTYRGTRYASLAELVQTLGADLVDTTHTMQLTSWPHLLVVSVAPSSQGYLVSGVWGCPWLQAMAQLRWVYLLTLAMCLALLFWGRQVMVRQLLSPIQQVNQALQTKQKWLLPRPSQVCRWLEGHTLQEQFQAMGGEYRAQLDEIQRLNTALTYAKTAEEHRRTLTSHIAHELKTPLAVIHSYVQGLQEHIAEEKREKYLATIRQEAERMNDMVLELLDFSRLEAGRVKLHREHFSLSALTRSLVEKWEPQLQAKGLHLSLQLSDPATVHADRGRMTQVMENLLTNAIKYTPTGGHLQVALSNTQTHTQWVIANDCPPMAPAELEQLFVPFYRRDNDAPGTGTGLGLAIVKNIVHLHGGSCTVQATQSGIAFTVTL